MESSERSKPSETKRVIKTATQLQSLKEAYAENKHLPPLGYAKLAEVIGLSRKQVRDWFREEREKDRVLKRKRESEDTDFDGAKTRTPKDPDVVEKLEKFYAENRYPDRAAYPKLAEELGLLKKQVIEWFHHRRYLERHSKTENEQDKELRSTKFQDRDYGTALWDSGIGLGTFERVSETTPKSQEESPCNIGKESENAVTTSENAVTKETSESEEESKGLEDDGPKVKTSEGFKIRNIKQPHVVRRLERYFRLLKNSKYLDKKSIAEELGLSPIEVSRWFSSRHAKERRLKLKRKEQERQKRQMTRIQTQTRADACAKEE